MGAKKSKAPNLLARPHYRDWKPKDVHLWNEVQSKFKGSNEDFHVFEFSLFCIPGEVPHPFRKSQLKIQRQQFCSLSAQLTKLKETIEPFTRAQYGALEKQLQDQAQEARDAIWTPSVSSPGYAAHVYAQRALPYSAKAATKRMGMKVLPKDLKNAIASLEHIALACQVLAKNYVPIVNTGRAFVRVEIGPKQVIANSIKRIFSSHGQKFTTSETGFAACAFRAVMSEYPDSTDDETAVQYWLKNAKE